MTEPAKRWTMPWGLVLTLMLLAGLIAALLRIGTGRTAPWDVVAASILSGGATFLAMRWMQNYFWGLVAAAALTVHPLYWQWAEPFSKESWAEALELMMLAVAIAGWRLAYRPDFAWPSWLLLVAVGLAIATAAWEVVGHATEGVFLSQGGVSTAAWEAERAPAVTTSRFVLLAFPLGGMICLVRYWRGKEGRPCPGNIVCAFFGGLVILACGVILASWRTGYQYSMTLDYWQQFLGINVSSLQLRGFQREQLDRWCWPSYWTIVPLMAWGLLRTPWRSWRQFKRRQPPTALLLTLFTALVAVDESVPAVLLPLATLSVLLPVFGIADVFRGISERLILLPPAERHE